MIFFSFFPYIASFIKLIKVFLHFKKVDGIVLEKKVSHRKALIELNFRKEASNKAMLSQKIMTRYLLHGCKLSFFYRGL